VAALALILILRQQGLKKDFNIGFVPSDLMFTKKIVVLLLFVGLLGGFLAGALGLGGGVLFNPILLSLGVPPQVSSSTGMYMIMFSTLSSSVVYIIGDTLNVQFGLWIGLFTALGSIAGLSGIDSLVKKYERQSIIVFALVFILFLCTVLIPLFGLIDLERRIDNGEIELWEFGTIC